MRPDKTELAALADLLANTWPDPSKPVALKPHQFPQNRFEAYFVQDRMFDALNESLAGWKVGATSAQMRALDGHDDIIPGRIASSTCYVGTHMTLPIARFPNARVETEFAFRLTETPELRKTPWRAEDMAEIMTLHPAIEIIGNRYQVEGASKAQNSLLTIADNGGGMAFVFGDPVDDWQDLDFQHHNITLRVDDKAAAENFLGDMRCVPAQAAADLVNHLASRNISMQADDFLSTGAATVPQPFVAGSTVHADFGTLGVIELTF
ncbi:2-keto-4-pentenoate hydratase [Candidatus Puniceispirillum marinum]|uniref:Putative Hydratase/decarboxylase n=1 Tax=Puniceispirillum marinum (strain IMCC1322) TaxID=488538 RepID=D5BSB4_PUNMI|nr:hydratase [Candidatus Puniceispirillum marinum]ADE39161.1 putative Hydratase/decarboxylase [Candidatus Puniceispirillum marinum IMCC1322]